jgi:phasin family protein
MFSTQQFAELSQSNLEKSIRLANITLSSTERLFNLQMSLARDLIAENAQTAKAVASAKNPQELIELQKSLAQPSVEKSLAVARSVYDSAIKTQSELNKLLEEQMMDFNKSLLSSLDKAIAQAPAGTGASVSMLKNVMETAVSTYDSVSKTTQKIAADLTDAAVSAVESAAKTQGASASRSSRKAA